LPSDYQRLPDTGPITVYKRVDGAILTLWVPHDAARTSCLTSNKCRVDRAKVVASSEFGTEWKNLNPGRGLSVTYRLGQWVECDWFDDDIREACTHGIHCFATYAEAEAWAC